MIRGFMNGQPLANNNLLGGCNWSSVMNKMQRFADTSQTRMHAPFDALCTDCYSGITCMHHTLTTYSFTVIGSLNLMSLYRIGGLV